MISAFCAWRCGASVATAYDTLGEDAAAFAINQTKATVVFADTKLLKPLSRVAMKLPSVKQVIMISEEVDHPEGADIFAAYNIKMLKLADLHVQGGLERTAATPAKNSDIAVTMYTSGTTGNPKGVLMSHGNLLATMAGGSAQTAALAKYTTPGGRFLAYLPLAHIMEMIIELGAFSSGMVVGYGGVGSILATAPRMLQTKPPQLGDAAAFQPTLFLAAPAVLDRIFAVVNGKINAAPKPINRWFRKALADGAANFEKGKIGPNPLVGLIFKPVAKLLGGKVAVIGTGSAPLGLEIRKFCMTAFRCPVIQGYGLTETCGATCIGVPESFEHSVGPPQGSACIRLRDWVEGNYLLADVKNPDIGMPRGEILIGGPTVCQGYLVDKADPDPDVVEKNETEFTTIDGVRFFCTGDIGQITKSGTIQIVDRKKDLVKLTHGEYIALSKIENVLKSSRFVAVPLVHAKSTMSFCIALICPTPAARELAGANKDAKWPEICADEAVAKAVLEDLQAVCKAAKLNKFEIPQKCVLISDEFSVENEMMTAVRKLKRKPIADKHAKEISAIGYPV